MKSGLYGVFNLDQAPVSARDADALGLVGGSPAAARGVDLADPKATHIAAEGADLTILQGHFDDPHAVADALGLARTAAHAELARAGLRRWGVEAIRHMAGEWSFLDWDGDGTVTLCVSACVRDPLFYVVRGARVAVAPDVFALGRLSDGPNDLDETGVLYRLGRAPLRSEAGDRTVIVGVREVVAGTCVTIDARGCRVSVAAPLVPAAAWRGTFKDAMAEAEWLLRDIVRVRLRHAPAAACLLSGGLDSSLLAFAAAKALDPGSSLLCLTSAAPPGSGLKDETGYATIVADCLGLPIAPVAPADARDIYSAPAASFAMANGPSLSVRHYLYDTFADAAEAAGRPLLLEGDFGEYTFSAYFALATPAARLRRFVRDFLPRRGAPAENTGFHVRLAPHRLRALPTEIDAARRIPLPTAPMRSPRESWGIDPAFAKIARQPTELRAGAVRSDHPFRDPRLQAFFSGLPNDYVARGGLHRAPARHILQGHLPDSIRLRTNGMPFSPVHMPWSQTHASRALARIDGYYAQGIDDWLDLAWLRQSLEQIAANGVTDSASALEVQLTAMAAEFFRWWRGGQSDNRINAIAARARPE